MRSEGGGRLTDRAAYLAAYMACAHAELLFLAHEDRAAGKPERAAAHLRDAQEITATLLEAARADSSPATDNPD